jgi:Asp-tRNA(Asn)/Glu-tRNA(Gln) amidotransferase A subunit family amidase
MKKLACHFCIAVAVSVAVAAAGAAFQILAQGPAVTLLGGMVGAPEGASESFPIDLPPLGGQRLKAMVWALEQPFIGPLLARAASDFGPFARVREAGSLVLDEPEMYPVQDLHPERAKGHAQHAGGETGYGRECYLCGLNRPDDSFSNLQEWFQRTGSRVGGRNDHRWTVQDYVQVYRRGLLTPVQVLVRVLDAINATQAGDDRLGAIAFVNTYQAEQSARESSMRYGKDFDASPRSIWEGVPILVDGEMNLEGFGNMHGTDFVVANDRSPRDHIAIRRLKSAGAVIVGVTSVDELGLGSTGHHPRNGPVRNPYALNRYAGGSSGGGPAAVAAGIVPVSLGVDEDGGVRVPAGFCGVVSIKPTFGRLKEKAALSWTMGEVGVAASSVKDVALTYATIAGSSHIMERAQPTIHLNQFRDVDDLKIIKVGVWWKMFKEDTAPALAAAHYAALINVINVLEAKQVEVIPMPDIPMWNTGKAAYKATSLIEACQFMDRIGAGDFASLSGKTRARLAFGSGFSARDLLAAAKVRARMQLYFNKVLLRLDAIVTPVAGTLAPIITAMDEFDVRLENDISKFTWLANFIGLPAVTLPVGFNDDGLPISLQLIGSAWNEHRLLRIANAVEGELLAARAKSKIDLLKPRVLFSILGGVADCLNFTRPQNMNWGNCPMNGNLAHNRSCDLECKHGYEFDIGRQPHCVDGNLFMSIQCKPKSCILQNVILPSRVRWGSCVRSLEVRSEVSLLHGRSCGLECDRGFALVGDQPSCMYGDLTYNVSCDPLCEGFAAPENAALGTCRVDADECATVPCKNGGTCSESSRDMKIPEGEFRCSCTGGWSGLECMDYADGCATLNDNHQWVMPVFNILVDRTVSEEHFTIAMGQFFEVESDHVMVHAFEQRAFATSFLALDSESSRAEEYIATYVEQFRSTLSILTNKIHDATCVDKQACFAVVLGTSTSQADCQAVSSFGDACIYTAAAEADSQGVSITESCAPIGGGICRIATDASVADGDTCPKADCTFTAAAKKSHVVEVVSAAIQTPSHRGLYLVKRISILRQTSHMNSHGIGNLHPGDHIDVMETDTVGGHIRARVASGRGENFEWPAGWVLLATAKGEWIADRMERERPLSVKVDFVFTSGAQIPASIGRDSLSAEVEERMRSAGFAPVPVDDGNPWTPEGALGLDKLEYRTSANLSVLTEMYRVSEHKEKLMETEGVGLALNFPVDLDWQLVSILEIAAVEDIPVPCLNGGTCIDQRQTFACNCTDSWSGAVCEIPGDVCEQRVVEEGCTVRPAHESQERSQRTTCELQPAQFEHGIPGTCRHTGGIGRCEYVKGEIIVVDDCDPESTRCIVSEAVDSKLPRKCECLLGYYNDGSESGQNATHCTKSDECVVSGHLCLNGGTCVDGLGGYECHCAPGHTGERCNLLLPPCVTVTDTGSLDNSCVRAAAMMPGEVCALSCGGDNLQDTGDQPICKDGVVAHNFGCREACYGLVTPINAVAGSCTGDNNLEHGQSCSFSCYGGRYSLTGDPVTCHDGVVHNNQRCE